MSYTCLVYHAVFATYERAPLITPDVERRLYPILRDMMLELGGRPLAMNGTTDHIHLVFDLKASVALSFFVGQLKARSSPYLIDHEPRQISRWQAEYSAFTVNPNRMAGILDFVANQKLHHSTQRLHPVLEWTPSPLQPRPPFHAP